MKKLKTIFATLVLCLSMAATFSSCSDDDNDKDSPESTSAAKAVAGSYTDNMTCTVMGEASVFENLTFTLTATDDATVSVAMPSFGNPPMQLPAITVEGVKVAGSNGTYSLAPTEFSGKTDAGKAYSGTMQGSFANGRITLRFNLQYGAMPMPMICSFSATRK